jgi:RHS repeat-associated protein
MEYSLAGFNGQRPDPVSGHSHPGNGYRAYNPVLGRFTGPDSWSPFGAGGINPYAYCIGDPVNRADPSGHISGMGIAGMVVGTLGILMAPFTAGQSLTVMSCLTAGLEFISGATAIATGAFEDSSPSTSYVLGLVSLATGMLSLGIGIGAALRKGGGYLGTTGLRGYGSISSGDLSPLEKLMDPQGSYYVAGRNITKYLGGKSLDQLRMTSRTLKRAADAELIQRPLPNISSQLTFKEIVAENSGLSKELQQTQLGRSQRADRLYNNVRALTWTRRTLMGEGYNAPSQLMPSIQGSMPPQLLEDSSPVFNNTTMTRYNLPPEVSIPEVSAAEFRHSLGISGGAVTRNSERWERLSLAGEFGSDGEL